MSSELRNVDYYANYNNSYEDGGGDDDHEFSTKERNIKICRKTVLAPTYGGTINKVFVLPERHGATIVPSEYLVYGSYERVVGLVKLPLDGNPNKSMALIAHPGEISCICSSFDGKYLLTAGGSDRSVKLWTVNTNALEAAVQLGGKGIDPFMSQIEGGRGGEFFQDMLDYFYFAQLRSQGINTTARRKITGFIPVDQVIQLMRALGYFPTQQEVMDIENEIKFCHQTHLPSFKDKVDLEEFIKLYVNYRPVFGLGKDLFGKGFRALRKLKNKNDAGDSLSRDELCEHLQTIGEVMGADELVGALQALNGMPYNVPKEPLQLAEMLKSLLSKNYTPKSFAEEILGFEDYTQDN
jgi:Ca2+-binding EF-hand superfamily protein